MRIGFLMTGHMGKNTHNRERQRQKAADVRGVDTKGGQI